MQVIELSYERGHKANCSPSSNSALIFVLGSRLVHKLYLILKV